MWNDEDNNPYGSFDRRDSATSDIPQAASHTDREVLFLDEDGILLNEDRRLRETSYSYLRPFFANK